VVTINDVLLTEDVVMRAMLERENMCNRADLAEKIAMSEVASLRRQIGIMKLPAVCDYLDDLLEQKDKILVFSYHRDVAKGIIAKYGTAAVACTGDESGDEKFANVQKFITDPSIKMFVAQIKAGGQGIDGLQKVCDTVVFAELSYVPGEIDQAIDRLCRIGQENPINAHFLIYERSIDQEILAIIKRKRQIIKTLIKSEQEALAQAGL
jgi:SWI/SNF-related matrix-associated actin-dependent regulator 1 of chromatin subfamily A